MPLFEGLSYTGDKNVVIVDIGAAYTKCGLAGESGPRCIIPSAVKGSVDGKIKKIWEYNTEEELFDNLKDFLFVLYFRHLLVNPKDRRMVVCESLLCPASFRHALAQVLFKHYEVGTVMFSSGHLLSLLTLGSSIGLVMDLGYQEALVVPVYEGIPILKAVQSIPSASKAIHSRIKKMLLETAKVTTETREEKSVSMMPECLTEEILEDIKVRCCFVTKFSRAKLIREITLHGGDSGKLPTPPPGVQYPLDGGKVLHISGEIRERACEVMFEQDNEEVSIVTLILDAILQCPIDMRKELAENIVIIGGTAMLPGMYHRIKEELFDLMKKPKYADNLSLKKFKFHRPPAKENYTSWLGGAMFGALETLPSKSVTRDFYLQTGKLTDWCALDREEVA
ncbi:hypothetical protein ACJMK2_037633 [Sinanodonta woodiana]|uniref:Actin-related protein 10 n=1 Tax=Sinanodonta woodiana TaxID=1069815 RepID=A0ABD3WMD4_SINWO